jgi:hypothetical protein
MKKTRAKNNVANDWRLEKPPEGDFRFLGHPSHDARGAIKKHGRFEPWVLHCMCGKIHQLPPPPELEVGLLVMIYAINPLENPANARELNGQMGEVVGAPDVDGCYPIRLRQSGEVVLIPKLMLKTQVFTAAGTMFDSRKEFKSRAVLDENGKVVLPPLPPPKLKPEKKQRQSLGPFLKNFSIFIQAGVEVERWA